MYAEYTRGNFTVSADPARLDIDAIYAYLSETSYWARGIPREILERAIEHSLCFGLYEGGRQVGFARAVTDRATFAYLCDVYILDSHQGQGLGTWLIGCVMAHPDLQGLRRFNLATRDAHGLYRRFGFASIAVPERYMERLTPDVYKR